MSRRKLDKYQFSREANNVIERGKPLYTTIKGKWNDTYFKNDNPITLELACGKGEYSIGLAQQFPGRNFIGVDIKGDRLARGSKIALSLELENVAFLRTSIQYMGEFFENNEVDEIWLVHPDPQLRDRDEKKRLTNSFFLKSYLNFLKSDGIFHLKTDSFPLYEYSLDTLAQSEFVISGKSPDLYHSNFLSEHFGITTHYERAFRSKGFDINYIRAVNKKETSI